MDRMLALSSSDEEDQAAEQTKKPPSQAVDSSAIQHDGNLPESVAGARDSKYSDLLRLFLRCIG